VLAPRDFYEGETAHLLRDAHGRERWLDPLSLISTIIRRSNRTPLEGNYKGYHIMYFAPASSGGVGILQMLRQ